MSQTQFFKNALAPISNVTVILFSALTIYWCYIHRPVQTSYYSTNAEDAHEWKILTRQYNPTTTTVQD